MRVNIPKKFKEILAADGTVTALVNTIRFGAPVRNIVDADYPVIVIGNATLTRSAFRGTKDQDRLTAWSAPVYMAIKQTIADFEDSTIYDDLDTIVDAVVSALLTNAAFSNESPYIGIELESSEDDGEVLPPVAAVTFRFEVEQINSL